MKCKLEQKNFKDKSILLIEQKYEEYFLRKDKKEILLKLKKDLSKKYNYITSIELNIISNNIYDFACLTIGNASRNEICGYISYKNSYYSTQIPDNLLDWQPETQLFKELKLLLKKCIVLMKAK